MQSKSKMKPISNIVFVVMLLSLSGCSAYAKNYHFPEAEKAGTGKYLSVEDVMNIYRGYPDFPELDGVIYTKEIGDWRMGIILSHGELALPAILRMFELSIENRHKSDEWPYAFLPFALLVEMKYKPIIPICKEIVYESGSYWMIRRACLSFLGMMCDPSLKEFFEEIVEKHGDIFKAADEGAVYALAEIGDEKSIEVIRKWLKRRTKMAPDAVARFEGVIKKIEERLANEGKEEEDEGKQPDAGITQPK